MSAESELGVVCRNCGAEVSAFVTECPYCGQRLRKRAPKLKRVDGEVDLEAPVEKKRRRKLRRPRPRIPAVELGDARPLATGAVLLGAAILAIVQRAAELSLSDVGILFGTSHEWWRYLAAPFVYDDLGYLFAAGLGIAIFGPALERRIGTAPVLVLLVACGSLGALAAAALQDSVVIAGGNGMALGALAAWTAFARREEHAYEEDAPDWIAVAVCASVLLLIPLVEDTADPLAGIGGGLVGLVAGEIAVRARRA